MAKKKKTRKPITLWDGSTGLKPIRTDFWFDLRMRKPSDYTRGFPDTEEGSIKGAGRIIMLGYVARIGCFDRVKGKYRWLLERGERIPGTNLFGVIPFGPKDANERVG